MTVDYTTADDTALAGADYQSVSGTLVFAAGQITRTITVPVRGDVSFEGSETIFVNLSNSVGAVINDAQAVVTILNDDAQAGLPRITIDDVVVNPELDGPASFTLAPPVSYGVTGQAFDIKTADIDRDGDLDLVSVDLDRSRPLYVLKNNGDGTFASVVNYSLPAGSGGQHIDLTLNDFNGDLFPDVAVTLAGGPIAILINNGDGTFAAPISLAFGFASGITSADFDGDGDIDLAFTNAGPDTVSVLRNNGAGVFSLAATLAFPVTDSDNNIVSIEAGDVNGDSNVDLVVAKRTGGIFVYLNNGAGTFASGVAYGAGSQPYFLALGDVDGDGDIDVATSGSSFLSPRRVSIFRNNGNGTYASPVDYSLPGSVSTPFGIVLADINGDSSLDLICAIQFGNCFAMLLNDGTGVFGVPLLSGAVSSPSDIVAGDLDLDGDLDIASADTFTISVHENLRDPQVFATGSVRLSSPSSVAVSVTISTADGSARLGSDYQQTSTTLTIPAGSTSAPFSIPILSDALDEPNENFFVNLSAPVNATIADSQGQVTIVDDDGGVIAASTLTISDVTLAEGNAGTTNFVFNVTLTRPAGNNSVVTVQYQTADDAATAGGAQPDYSAAGPVTLTFAAGVTTQQITIPVNGDVFIEPDEAFFVNLLNPVGAILTDSRAVGLIQDDDGGVPTPLVLVNDVLLDETSSGVVSAIVTISLSSPASAPVSITLSTADGSARAGSDYTATTTTISIPIGGTSGTASIPVSGDTRDELGSVPKPRFFGLRRFARVCAS